MGLPATAADSIGVTPVEAVDSVPADSVPMPGPEQLTASQRRRERLGSPYGDDEPVAPKSPIVRQKVDINNTVHGTSSDSMVILGQNKAFMYGNGDVGYDKLKITASQIEIDLQTNNVYAVGRPDSTGEVIGSPVFDDNGTSYEAKTMDYNFKTEKGYITDVITQQGEGYLTGGRTKKVGENTLFTQDGK